ncbi:MAG: AAA family ATPase, partial [Bacteroidales bacterium]
MLHDYIESLILSKFNFSPTNHQKEAIKRIALFLSPANLTNVFILKGYAGTGKTTLASAIISSLYSLKIEFILLAPTGRAAKNFSSITNKPAWTIHKKIYTISKNTNSFREKFELQINTHSNTLFIIDEASLINDAEDESNTNPLLSDVIEYVFSGNNCKIIFIGDNAQLPPVGYTESPALNLEYITKKYLLECDETSLKEVVRQKEFSGILHNLTILRTHIVTKNSEYPKLNIQNYYDIFMIDGNDLVDAITSSYNEVGIEQTIVITRTNKRTVQYNLGIRNRVFDRNEDLLKGEIIMIVKNNYYWTSNEDVPIDFIANGEQ